VYLVCFDLSKDEQDQIEQLTYWLDFLDSFIAADSTNSKLKVILVGTRSDLNKSQPLLHSNPIPKWQHLWPSLPLHHEIFSTSKFNQDCFSRLLKTVKHECQAIVSTNKVPKTYLSLLKVLQAQVNSQRHSIIRITDLQAGYSKQCIMPALKYLHAIGGIALVEDLVCIDPTSISNLMSNFISPSAVQLSLPHMSKLQVLTSDEVGTVLVMKQDDPKYALPIIENMWIH
jgi:hypothetical protein